MATGTHVDQVQQHTPGAPVGGSEECQATGGRWVHLRMCQTRGHVGCCDDTLGRHATAHQGETGHPITRLIEPGEDWSRHFEAR